jgi:hypothetical protein
MSYFSGKLVRFEANKACESMTCAIGRAVVVQLYASHCQITRFRHLVHQFSRKVRSPLISRAAFTPPASWQAAYDQPLRIFGSRQAFVWRIKFIIFVL